MALVVCVVVSQRVLCAAISAARASHARVPFIIFARLDATNDSTSSFAVLPPPETAHRVVCCLVYTGCASSALRLSNEPNPKPGVFPFVNVTIFSKFWRNPDGDSPRSATRALARPRSMFVSVKRVRDRGYSAVCSALLALCALPVNSNNSSASVAKVSAATRTLSGSTDGPSSATTHDAIAFMLSYVPGEPPKSRLSKA